MNNQDKSISKSSGKESTYSTNLWSRKGTLASIDDAIEAVSYTHLRAHET